MSFTGNFLSAEEALHFGLVNHVVAHEDLMAFTRSLAADIIGNDQPGVRQIRSTYGAITAEREGWAIEARDSRAWRETNFSAEAVEQRRSAIQARGRRQ
jgi:enoyl-CoA hydratase